jgi:V/A-type H+-transporting ATPase subunit K
MNGFVYLLAFSILGLLVIGGYFHFRPIREPARAQRWWRGSMGANLVLGTIGILGFAVSGAQEALAAGEAAAGAGGEISTGLGLALLGIGLPTGLAAIGAGIAVGTVGAAALALLGEKPEMFGRTLIFVGLAEGIAIYGLVVTILLLGKV